MCVCSRVSLPCLLWVVYTENHWISLHSFESCMYVQALRAQGLELVASILPFGQSSILSHSHQVYAVFH